LPYLSQTKAHTLNIRKHAVIAEVYPVISNFIKEEEIPATKEPLLPTREVKMSSIAKIPLPDENTMSVLSTPVLHEVMPFYGAEINVTPRIPPIPMDEPLPKDLENMIN